MKKSTLLLLVVTSLVLLAAVVYFLREPPSEHELDGVDRHADGASSTDPGGVAAPARDENGPTRSEVAASNAAATANDPEPAADVATRARANGRVLDTHGSPIADVALALRDSPQDEIARSGRDGAFEFAVPASIGALLGTESFQLEVLAGQRWTSTCTTPFSSKECSGLLLVVAPSIELGGVVVDESGALIEGASVSLEFDAQQLRDFPLKLDHNGPRTISVATKKDGTFLMRPVPAIGHCWLVATHGDSRGVVSLPTSTTLDLRLVLKPDRRDEKRTLHGIVLSAQGEPADKASVMLGTSTTKTAADGRFELAVPEWLPDGTQLFAVKQGFQPAVFYVAERLASHDESPLVLRLGPPTLEIRGTVLLADGTPAKNWTVAMSDGTEVSRGRAPPIFAEHLAAGVSANSRSPATNASGEFTLSGLSARTYTVRAWHPKSLLPLRAEGVAAGTHDLVLRVPADATWPEIHGVVVDRRGAAVPKAKVGLQLTTFQSGGAESWIPGAQVECSADGSFTLKDVPRSEVRVTVSGDALMDARFEIAPLRPENGLRLTVDLRCHFRVLCERKDVRVDELNVLDADDDKLQIYVFQSGGWMSTDSVSIDESGTTHALAVSEQARTAVLLHEYKEVARLPLALRPGEVNEVRY